MNKERIIIVILAGALVWVSFNRPSPVVEQKIEYVDRVITEQVEKIVEVVVEKEVIRWKTQKVTEYVTKPDGTTINRITETDVRSQEDTKVASKDNTSSQKADTSVTLTVDTKVGSGLSLGLLGGPTSLRFDSFSFDLTGTYWKGNLGYSVGVTYMDNKYGPKVGLSWRF